jgi:enamine deaminase RidA (YjgF/YER057c/UK114 family)
MRQVIQNAPGVYPLEAYAQAIRVDKTIYVSALVPLDEHERPVAIGDFRGQATRVFENLAAVLRSAGAEMRHVVRLTSYITDVRNQMALREVRRAALGETRATLSLNVVVALQRPEFLVAIDAIAVVDDE